MSSTFVDFAGAVWRKSSFSNSNGDCVEVARLPVWRKSSFSNNGGDCVEVARVGECVGVRDSKNPDAGALAVDPAAWHAFTAALRTGDLA